MALAQSLSIFSLHTLYVGYDAWEFIAYNVTTLTSFFAHARSRKVISSSRPKISLPVTGNLANEILSGASLAGGLRVLAREATEGIFCRLSRVILRPVSIASVTIGIAFKSSVGF